MAEFPSDGAVLEERDESLLKPVRTGHGIKS